MQVHRFEITLDSVDVLLEACPELHVAVGGLIEAGKKYCPEAIKEWDRDRKRQATLRIKEGPNG